MSFRGIFECVVNSVRPNCSLMLFERFERLSISFSFIWCSASFFSRREEKKYENLSKQFYNIADYRIERLNQLCERVSELMNVLFNRFDCIDSALQILWFDVISAFVPILRNPYDYLLIAVCLLQCCCCCCDAFANEEAEKKAADTNTARDRERDKIEYKICLLFSFCLCESISIRLMPFCCRWAGKKMFQFLLLPFSPHDKKVGKHSIITSFNISIISTIRLLSHIFSPLSLLLGKNYIGNKFMT